MLLALVPGIASPARAADTGTIEGQVVAKGGAGGVGGTPVVLEIGTGAATPDERSTAAGDDGRFRFDGVPLSGNYVYLLKVTFDGGSYFREVTFPSGATSAQAAPVEVYPSTRDDEAIAFPRLRTLVLSVDQTGMQLVETGAYRNGGDRAYVGPSGSADGATLQFAIPEGAGGVSPETGLNRDTLVEAPNGFATIEAIPPGGEVQFAYTYGLFPQGKTLIFDRVFPYRTDIYQLYLPPAVRLENAPAGLRDTGVTTLQNGQQFRIYALQNVAPNTRLTVRLTNLPTGNGEVNPLLPAMAVFVLVLGLGLMAVYGRRRRVAAPTIPARTPATTPPRVTPAARPNGAARSTDEVAAGAGRAESDESLLERRRRLLLALVDLDERHEAGTLPEPEYRRERAARKEELVGVLRELEAGARQPT